MRRVPVGLKPSIPFSALILPIPFPHLKPLLSLHHRSLSITASSSTIPVYSTYHHHPSSTADENGNPIKGSKVLLKGMRYFELQNWVQSHGYRPGQALMLWKRLYGNNIWAHCIDELEGLNKDFKSMLSEHAEFKALTLKDIIKASDGTRKEVADFIHVG